MNVLEIVKAVPGLPSVILGYLPEKPDTVVVLMEYAANAPVSYFGSTEESWALQVRSRSPDWATAYNNAVTVQKALDRYVGGGVAIRQISNILDIGQDAKGRREFTVNFKINSTGG